MHQNDQSMNSIFKLLPGLILIFVLSFLCDSPVCAQMVRGAAVDSIDGTGLGYAAVTLIDGDSAVVAGAIADSSGHFLIEKLRRGNYRVQIRSMGYYQKTVLLTLDEAHSDVNLGRIALLIDEKVLAAAVATGDSRIVALKSDRKIITVDKASAGAGASLSDLLQILPEIRVDNGDITLKNQSFTVYMNGKPAAITRQQLFQIPASTVEKLEVITNPSVRYAPDGLGGIINIIPKKHLEGLNGIVQLAARTDNNYGGALTVNHKLKHLNLFATLYPQYYNAPTDGYRRTVLENAATLHEQLDNRSEYFSESFKLGFDYDFSSKDFVTLYWSQLFTQGRSAGDIHTDFAGVDSSDQSRVTTASDYLMRENTVAANYRHIFARKGTSLSVDFIRRSVRYPQSRVLESRSVAVNSTSRYKISSDDPGDYSRLSANLTARLSGSFTLDAGIDCAVSRETSKYNNVIFVDGVQIDSLRASFDLNSYIPSVYSLLEFEYGSLNCKGGVRAEYSHRQSGLSERYSERYDFYFYPSFSASYSLGECHEFNLSYSRRIERPEIYQLSPIAAATDYLSERHVGNPDLNPSFSSSFDLGYSFAKKPLDLNASLSYMHTTDEIDYIFHTSSDLQYKSYGNIADKKTWMLDVGLSARFNALSLYLTGSGYNNSYTTRRSGGVSEQSNHWSYDLRFVSRLNLKHACTFSLQAIYYGAQYYARMRRSDSFRLSLTASKTFNSRLTVSLSALNLVNHIFHKYMWGDGFRYESFFNNHDTGIFRIGLMYKFGKAVKTRTGTDLNESMIRLDR